ncbi:MFS transporter [Planctomonas sp. JC2975]|uniref:MFS transporter n=1 Tax=Planctomonas sp. JC2975 TaxID=2729626 RepID=UPI001473DA30|nr:MFS transporter [Planctomonas sp. JC2975]NNC13688.1 MFS transporter [Planctomonas sp. JC2975]
MGRTEGSNRQRTAAATVNAARRRWTLAATGVGFAVVQLDVSVVNVAVKPIGDELGGGVAALQWIVSAYTVAFAAFILSAGALGDRLGAKRMLLAGFTLFIAASLVCALAPNLGVLIAARAVQGMGAAALVPSSLSVLSHTYPDARARAGAVGIWALAGSAALSAGPLVGGVLIQTLGWRWIFYINIPLALFGILVVLLAAAETTRSTERRLDIPGQVLGVVALGLLTAGIIEGGQFGFDEPFVVGALVLAVAAGTAFVLVERRMRQPMLPVESFRIPLFRWSIVIGLFVNVAFYGLIFVLSLFFQRAQHASALVTGFVFLPMTLAVMLTNFYAARLQARFGSRVCVMVSAAVLVVCSGALLFLDVGTPYAVIVVQLVGLGAALGVIVPIITSSALAGADVERSGVASATLNTARQTGSAVGVALYGAQLGRSIVGGFRVDLGITIVLSALILGAGSRLDDRHESQRDPAVQ